MPELPELEVLREYLGPRVEGRKIAQVWTSPKLSFLLRTPPDEYARQLIGGTFERVWRRGKFVIFDISGQHLVINPMLGGRLQWTKAYEKVAAATVFRITLEGGDELRFLDTVKMGRVYWVVPGALPTIPGWAELGPDALTVTVSEFSQRIRRHPGELKNLLRNQAFIAGVGNAYSDEILHEAELLPLRKRTTLKPDELSRLYAATRKVLASAIESIKADGGSAIGIPTDGTENGAVKEMADAAIRELGGIDILVNNAGIGLTAPIADASSADVDTLFGLNVIAAAAAIRAVIPIMRAQGSGMVINISSMAGRVVIPRIGYYSASKFALTAIGDALRMEESHRGIKVMNVFPGTTQSSFGENRLGTRGRQAHQVLPPVSAEKVARRVAQAVERDQRSVY